MQYAQIAMLFTTAAADEVARALLGASSRCRNGLRLSALALPGATPAEGDDDGKNHRYAENHVFR